MINPKKIKEKPRSFGRRAEDFIIRKDIQRFKRLSIIGQSIISEIKFNALIPVIMEQTNKIMDTERSTVFIFDHKTNELWSLIATGMGSNRIRMPADRGIAGSVFISRKPLLINDAYKDPHFNVAVDCEFGFKTKNIVCVPLINRYGKCIGVLQALNSRSGKFTEDDSFFLKSISDYVTIAIENAKLYDNVNRYSEHLKKVIVQNESLENIKNRLSKFVPLNVAKLVEKRPDILDREKTLTSVSILFVDIQNFSTITDGYDQRMINHMIENHFSSYLNCIHQHDGELNETSGDGLMVIFQNDTKENQAYRAVKAGLGVIRESKRINQNFNYPWGPIDLHISVNSGNAYVGTTRMKSNIGERWVYTASGLVTVIASRIGALSENSKLYVGSNTYNLIHKDFDCEFIGNRKLKNISESRPVYWVKYQMK